MENSINYEEMLQLYQYSCLVDIWIKMIHMLDISTIIGRIVFLYLVKGDITV